MQDTSYSPDTQKRADSPWDIAVSAIAALVFVGHVVLILGGDAPYWSFLFCLAPGGQYAWPMAGIGLALLLIRRRATAGSSPVVRATRAVLASVLLLFAADSLTGGDHRWFELAMRWEMQKCDGPVGLQAWAQDVLSSAEELESLERDGVPQSWRNGRGLPPAIQRFAEATCSFRVPEYRPISDEGPMFVFSKGRDSRWGVMVGKQDLLDPSPYVGVHGLWTKQLSPGVFLFVY